MNTLSHLLSGYDRALCTGSLDVSLSVKNLTHSVKITLKVSHAGEPGTDEYTLTADGSGEYYTLTVKPCSYGSQKETHDLTPDAFSQILSEMKDLQNEALTF